MPNPLDVAIEELRVEIEEDSTIIDGAVTFINGVPALIQAAVDEALAQGATPAQLQAITDLKTKISDKADALKAAIEAGTTS